MPLKLERGPGPLTIWHMPQPGRMYAMGVDPAEGTGKAEADNACIQILDAVTGVQCAEFTCNSYPPMDLGKYAVKLGKFYGGPKGQAFAVVERNNHGHATVDAMVIDGYRNFYVARTRVAGNQPWTNKIGWMTSSATKDELVDKGRACYSAYPDLINSRELHAEMKSFYYKDTGKTGYAPPEALEGARDDRVMAWLLALMGVRFAAGQLAVAKEGPAKAKPWEERVVEASIVEAEAESRKRRKRVRRAAVFEPWSL